MDYSDKYKLEEPELVAKAKPPDYTIIIIIGAAVAGILILYCLYRLLKACLDAIKKLAKSMEMAPKKGTGVADAGFYVPEFPKEGKIARQEDQPQNRMFSSKSSSKPSEASKQEMTRDISTSGKDTPKFVISDSTSTN